MRIPKLLLFITCCTLVYACSKSGGVQPVPSPAGPNSQLPYLTTDHSGTLYLSWTEQLPTGATALKYASYGTDERWSTTQTIATGDDWFVNWADYPSILANDNNLIAAHWLHKVPGGTYAYEVRLSMMGGSQDTVLTPHFDGTATEHGFVSMLPWLEDSVLGIWLDGRRTANRAEDEYSDLSRAMTLRSAIIQPDGNVTQPQVIDTTVCDCCQTSLAATSNGAIAAYRNRTDEEIRDIYVSRYQQGAWSEPVRVHPDNWKIGGCPVNGPVIKARGDTVLVTWFTGADDTYQVKASFSYDGGTTFQPPVIINENEPIGRLDAAVTANDYSVVSWMEQAGDSAALKVRAIQNNSQELSPVRKVSSMSRDRQSGFPQMTAHNGHLFFAWTAVGDQHQIKMASIPLEHLMEN